MDQLIAPVTPANPATIHDVVLTHLRPCYSHNYSKRIGTHQPPLPITPSIGRVPSLYHQSLPSSPYVFDHDFYNNSQIINGDVSFEDVVFDVETNRQAKHLHRAHESIMESSQLDDEFEPIDMPNPPRLLRARLVDNCDIKCPKTFFAMFMANEQFDLLAQNTNAYAAYQLENHPEKHRSRKS
jgi:hypothetical protein